MPNPNSETPTAPPTCESQGALIQTFATPIARIKHPLAEGINPPLAEVLLARLGKVENKFTYKAETAADMTAWGEPMVDSVTAWVVRMARRFAETAAGRNLDEVFAASSAGDEATFNSASGPRERRAVSITASRSWTSVYRAGDHHPAHFHPNTAIAAIYYVAAPRQCELDLIDPRANIDFFDPGLTFAGEGQNFRLRCEPGELVLFPGWLKHSVPEFHREGLRISMSWNLGYVLTKNDGHPDAADGEAMA